MGRYIVFLVNEDGELSFNIIATVDSPEVARAKFYEALDKILKKGANVIGNYGVNGVKLSHGEHVTAMDYCELK